ncbi:HNH endonuclease signature motif containing protein [Cryobacterium tepidiphilum]|uniref:HNH endonuclease signature motif containing protein n=1 Tax=Cryobacterium tepidiphilum TaxID=2486026 RepID=UPI00131461FC|nr:HNH endonuclease signature motif containing protein [Cryobacterium tepidiphilum]
MRLGELTRPRQEMGEILPPLFPAVAAGLSSGELGVDSADAITAGLAEVAPRAEVADLQAAERALVAAATGVVTAETADVPYPGFAFSADLIRGQVQVWAARLDPDGVVPTEVGREARSSIGFGRLRNGLYPLRGGATPELRGIMDNVFNTYLSARAPLPGPAFPTEKEQALIQERIDAGELIPGAEQILDDRTGGEKRADILRMVFDAAARQPGTPTMGGAAPTVTVHVNATDLTTGRGAGWVDGVEAPVSLRTVRQAMCAGGYEEVIFSEHGNILGWSKTQRCFTAQQRKALLARDGDTCIIPDCPIPAQWCEAHHVIPWQQINETSIDNGVLLCWYHHHTIHTSGWQIRMIRGRPQVKAPPWVDHTGTWRPAGTHRATTPTARLTQRITPAL